MNTIAQLYRKNQRDRLTDAKRLAFDARVNHLVEAGQLESDAPLADRVHAILLANRPNAGELPAPVKLEAPAPAQPLYDLLIAAKKYGYGSRSRDAQDAPIVWLKFAGEEKRPPKDPKITLAHPSVQKFLLGYELVATEAHQFEIVKKYRKINGEAL